MLVRRLQALESLARIDTVIFDKTGTLTEARMGLRAVRTRDGVKGTQALQLAAALAQYSRHPASCALVAAAQAASPALVGPSEPFKLIDIQEFAGLGLQGTLTASPLTACVGQLRLGSARFCKLDCSSYDLLPDTLQVCLADESGWLACFDLDEMVRPDAAAAVTALQAAGVAVRMLSGDHQLAARRVADQIGISQVQGDSTPQSKLQCLLALQQQGRQVLMVGDGLNDGPVLAGANVSVAMGTAVALAQAQSDFLIPGGQLMMVPGLLVQARRTMRIVRQNLWWAVIYNAVCVPLALTGSLPAWLAGLGMAVSSLLVIANAARLARSPQGV